MSVTITREWFNIFGNDAGLEMRRVVVVDDWMKHHVQIGPELASGTRADDGPSFLLCLTTSAIDTMSIDVHSKAVVVRPWTTGVEGLAEVGTVLCAAETAGGAMALVEQGKGLQISAGGNELVVSAGVSWSEQQAGPSWGEAKELPAGALRAVPAAAGGVLSIDGVAVFALLRGRVAVPIRGGVVEFGPAERYRVSALEVATGGRVAILDLADGGGRVICLADELSTPRRRAIRRKEAIGCVCH